jgi:hypothetical protein
MGNAPGNARGLFEKSSSYGKCHRKQTACAIRLGDQPEEKPSVGRTMVGIKTAIKGESAR